MDYAAIIDSPFGRLGIRTDDRHLTSIDFLTEATACHEPVSALGWRVVTQLRHYFTDPTAPFDLPLDPHGTAYQQRVWEVLTDIPAGDTRSYGAVAAQLDSGARAVGGACRRNPIPIVIPCHRVVAAHGHGGYSGHTTGPVLDVKLALLAHEARPA